MALVLVMAGQWRITTTTTTKLKTKEASVLNVIGWQG